MNGSDEVLKIEGLRTHFFTHRGIVKAVDDVSFSIRRGEVMGLVGESGCGKSVTALSIMRLIQSPGKILSGKILFEKEDLLQKDEDEMREVRGSRIGMVFQDPMSTLNPALRVGEQIAEAIVAHGGSGSPGQSKLSSTLALLKHTSFDSDIWKRSIGLMEKVGVSQPDIRIKNYPHQFSGGMCQRVMLAIAIAMEPRLLIADEPTTALDVITQAQILELIKYMKDMIAMSVLFITHDLGVVSELCDRVCVMYAGKIVETCPTHTLFREPLHPYTKALLRCRPILGEPGKRLEPIAGNVPDLVNLPSGCGFAPRCPASVEQCRNREEGLFKVAEDHFVRCTHYKDS